MTVSRISETKKADKPNNYFLILKGAKMDKYECICGYVYDPAKGDVDNGVNPGTAFADLPADWVCPLCGATQDNFKKLD